MPEKFERYLIEGKLGQGGMAAVYLATDQSLNRQIALKVINSDDKESLERFQREAHAVAKLKHPNIVQIYDVGIFGSRHYFTMEYIDGVTLDKMIEASFKPSIQDIINIISQVASALDYAHQNGIVHRDIKPSNILINKSGNAYLADFGIAKQVTGLDKKLTVTGTTVGTPEYMSPEQTKGNNKEIDSRSDIFSLGATLYHCITSRLPFEGGNIYETISNIVNKDPAPPTTIVRSLNRDIETICLKCLDKDKTKRYQTAGELVDDLKRYLSGEPILARRTMYVTKAWYKAKKNKAASLGVASAVVILLIALIAWRVGAAGTAAKLAQYRKEAYACYGQNKYEDARVACEKIRAITKADEKLNALYEKCLAVIEQEKAQAKVREEKSKIRERAKMILGRASAANKFEEKMTFANEALKIDPDFGEAYHFIGKVYTAKAAEAGWDSDEYPKLIDKAYEYFTEAIKTTPTLAYSYYERAVINLNIYNKLEKALDDFEKVLNYDPNSYMGWFAKGVIEDAQQKYDQAIASYTKAIDVYPDYGEAYGNRGNTYSHKGDLDKAIEDFTRLIKLDQRSWGGYNNRAIAYMDKAELESRQGGNAYRKLIDQSIADYDEAIRINPRYIEAYANRGSAYRRKGELDKAMADYNEAIRLNPKYGGAYFNRGNIYMAKNELDKAIADYDEAIRLVSNYAEGYVNRGIAYKNKGETDKAIAD
ncbi:MAG: tetratricopeptide repeat protein, partial [Planctomycetota bacterium]